MFEMTFEAINKLDDAKIGAKIFGITFEEIYLLDVLLPFMCKELTAFTFKTLRLPASPPTVPIPKLPERNVVKAVDLEEPVEYK